MKKPPTKETFYPLLAKGGTIKVPIKYHKIAKELATSYTIEYMERNNLSIKDLEELEAPLFLLKITK